MVYGVASLDLFLRTLLLKQCKILQSPCLELVLYFKLYSNILVVHYISRSLFHIYINDFFVYCRDMKKFTISYPCVMLNVDVAKNNTNDQYQVYRAAFNNVSFVFSPKEVDLFGFESILPCVPFHFPFLLLVGTDSCRSCTQDV